LKNRKKLGFSVVLLCLFVILFITKVLYRNDSVDTVSAQSADIKPVSLTIEALEKNSKSASVAENQVANITPKRLDNPNFARSLQGTEIDGALAADHNGNLILDISVRDFFDYFLTASDEVGAYAAINEIVRYANDYLPEQASQQAISLLQDYLRYKKAELQIHSVPIFEKSLTDQKTVELLSENFEALKAQRQQIFDPQTDQALFGLEDRYAQYTLDGLKLRTDGTLTNAQRAKKLGKLRDELPVDLARSENNHQRLQQEQQSMASLLNSSMDDSQLYEQLTDRGVSDQKAQELLIYRQKQAYFEQQYQRYQHAQNNQSSDGLNSEQLRNQFFVTPENRTKASLRDLNQ